MKVKRPGALRHRLILEAHSLSDDGSGGHTTSWVQQASVWAALQASAGRERLKTDRLSGTVTHNVWLRYRDDVSPSMRFRNGAATYHILAILDEEGDRRWLRCLCEVRDL